MRNLTMVVLVVICLSWAGEGEATTGNKLLTHCEKGLNKKDPDLISLGYCYAYITGAGDTYRTILITFPEINLKKYCIPDASNQNQIVKVVNKYLEEHPEKLHLPGDHLILSAMQEAFPCPKEPGK